MVERAGLSACALSGRVSMEFHRHSPGSGLGGNATPHRYTIVPVARHARPCDHDGSEATRGEETSCALPLSYQPLQAGQDSNLRHQDPMEFLLHSLRAGHDRRVACLIVSDKTRCWLGRQVGMKPIAHFREVIDPGLEPFAVRLYQWSSIGIRPSQFSGAITHRWRGFR